uniref:Uncharacterized protein n=1 Tax=Arundo donax TaxID=35708 RepID=A0A0A9DWH8_ARUDO
MPGHRWLLRPSHLLTCLVPRLALLHLRSGRRPPPLEQLSERHRS